MLINNRMLNMEELISVLIIHGIFSPQSLAYFSLSNNRCEKADGVICSGSEVVGQERR
jgi:hypothetical protein